MPAQGKKNLPIDEAVHFDIKNWAVRNRTTMEAAVSDAWASYAAGAGESPQKGDGKLSTTTSTNPVYLGLQSKSVEDERYIRLIVKARETGGQWWDLIRTSLETFEDVVVKHGKPTRGAGDEKRTDASRTGKHHGKTRSA